MTKEKYKLAEKLFLLIVQDAGIQNFPYISGPSKIFRDQVAQAASKAEAMANQFLLTYEDRLPSEPDFSEE